MVGGCKVPLVPSTFGAKAEQIKLAARNLRKQKSSNLGWFLWGKVWKFGITQDFPEWYWVMPSRPVYFPDFFEQRDHKELVLSRSLQFGNCPLVSSCLVLFKTSSRMQNSSRDNYLLSKENKGFFRVHILKSNRKFLENEPPFLECIVCDWGKDIYLILEESKTFSLVHILKFGRTFLETEHYLLFIV